MASKHVTAKVRSLGDEFLDREIAKQARRYRCAWRAVERAVKTARYLARVGGAV